MSMDVEVAAPAEGEAQAEETAAEMLADDVAAQVALAVVALQEALPVECASISVEGLDADGDVVLVCKPVEGDAVRYAVPAEVMSAALDAIEPEDAEGDE